MPPDSPNPSPTQEVERYDCDLENGVGQEPDRAFMQPWPTGDYVKYEDHQQLLQAEVVKREEVEKEREDWRGKAEVRLVEWRNVAADADDARCERDEAESSSNMWRDRARAAESKLSSAAEELGPPPQQIRGEGE